MATTVNIHDGRTHVSRLVERARQGERITIAPAGVSVAMLVATMDLPDDAGGWIRTRVAVFDLTEPPITVDHGVEAALLSRRQRDPWDRLLIAQARVEEVPILTADLVFSRYDVETIS